LFLKVDAYVTDQALCTTFLTCTASFYDSTANVVEVYLWYRQGGNKFEDTYEDLHFVAKQILLVHLRVEKSHILFDPPLADCQNVIYECFLEIISAGSNIPRVSLRFVRIKDGCL